MTKAEVRRRICDIGIVPVVRAASPELAIAASLAIVAGGISVIELTMTIPCAIDAIAELRRRAEGVVVGAGTVLDADTAQRCIDAGAEFIVSPGIDSETVQLAKREQILMMAGALTPTEVIQAWKLGSDIVKIFPCGSVGGPTYMKSLKTALPAIEMLPTGGVNLSNAAAFLRAGAVALGVGNELVAAASVTETARHFLEIVKGVRHERC
jgi:2-dehydro-3-deoxyphosphogluconate aldolase/(4S)-4-hydroxy-2-oxoglutarate aldolase